MPPNQQRPLTAEADSRAPMGPSRAAGHEPLAGVRARDAAEVPIVTMTAPAPAPIGGSILANLPVAELYERAIRAGEGTIAAEGPLVVRTGQHTGRSPKDKFVVREPWSQDKVWWGEVNHEISEEHYDRLRARLVAYVADKQLYAQDMYIGAHEAHRRSLRVYTETAWASIFARNLFRRPPREDLASFVPNFTIIDVPSFQADPDTDGHPERHGDPRSTSGGWRSSSSGRCTRARSRSPRSRS